MTPAEAKEIRAMDLEARVKGVADKAWVAFLDRMSTHPGCNSLVIDLGHSGYTDYARAWDSDRQVQQTACYRFSMRLSEYGWGCNSHARLHPSCWYRTVPYLVVRLEQT